MTNPFILFSFLICIVFSLVSEISYPMVCSYSAESDIDDSIIPWEASCLKWTDFKNTPPLNQKLIVASTYSGIKWSGKAYNDDTIQFNIVSNFYQKKSWTRTRDSLTLLHEQKHFDITELFARKVRKYILNSILISKEILKVYGKIQSIVKLEQNYQKLYDKETNHGNNTRKQLEWNIKIGNELVELDEYKDTLILRPIIRIY